MKKLKTKKIISISAVVLIVILLIICSVVFTYQRVYAQKIYSHVSIGNLDLSGKNREQAEELLKNKFDPFLDKEIVLKAGDKEAKAKLSDTGYSFKSEEMARQAMLVGKEGSFFQRFFRTAKTLFAKTKVPVSSDVDQNMLNSFLSSTVGQLNFDPKDATLKTENGSAIITESVEGQKVGFDGLGNQIANADTTKDDSVVLQLNTEAVPPAVKTADLLPAKEQAEAILNKKVTFEYEGKKFEPTKKDIGGWIEIKNDKGKFSAVLNDAKVKSYLATVAKSIDVKMVQKQINGWTGEVVNQGSGGIALDRDRALKDIKDKISSNSNITIALTVTKSDPTTTKFFPDGKPEVGRYGGKYLDVNLTYQKMCQIEGNAAIDCFTISSGAPSSPTPEGDYKIKYKEKRRWTRLFSQWMPWWQQFDGDYGIHEVAEFPDGTKDGLADLGKPASHGCVRMGIGVAELIYNWTKVGTPIYIHK